VCFFERVRGGGCAEKSARRRILSQRSERRALAVRVAASRDTELVIAAARCVAVATKHLAI
jgi:hypothetical protein